MSDSDFDEMSLSNSDSLDDVLDSEDVCPKKKVVKVKAPSTKAPVRATTKAAPLATHPKAIQPSCKASNQTVGRVHYSAPPRCGISKSAIQAQLRQIK